MTDSICFFYSFSQHFTISIYEREKYTTNLNGIDDMISKILQKQPTNIEIINTTKQLRKFLRSYQFQEIRKVNDMRGYTNFKKYFIWGMSSFLNLFH